MTKNSINYLLNPKSIAIVGASSDINKLNGRPLHYLVRDGYNGRLYPVNPGYDQIGGIKCYADIDSLPEAPDMAIVAVQAKKVEAVIEQLGAKGTPVALVFASGFSETGAKGAELERALMDVARKAGVRICGPNNLGIINAFDGIIATFSQYAQRPPIAGPIAFASQSGAFGTAITSLARQRNLGIGFFINTGNQADISLFEALDGLVDDDRIQVLSGYVEGLRDGRELIALSERAIAAQKPLVITKVGRKEAGARAVASHTGSLAGEDRVFDSVLRQHGITRARNEEHMLDLLSVFSSCELAKGRGVGIITQSGGAGVLMADRAEELGLDVPTLSKGTQDKLAGVMPSFGAAANPVDVTGQFLAEPTMMIDTIRIVLEDRQVHVATVWLQLMEEYADILVDVFTQAKKVATKPFIVCWVAAPEKALRKLQENGICVISATERTIDAAAGLIELGSFRQRHQLRKLLTHVPPPAMDVTTVPVGSIKAAEMLGKAGLSLAPCEVVKDGAGARFAAERLGYPVVIKIESPDILHKTEVGGVSLNLKTADEVEAAANAIFASAMAKAPKARIEGVLVQRMVKPETEIVLGVRRDPVFGPVIMAGLGGIFVEVLKDVAFAAAPVTQSDAEIMLDQLQGKALLEGVRGQAAVNRQALIDTICRLSDFAVSYPELAELDLNPVFAGPDGVAVVDWLMMVDAD